MKRTIGFACLVLMAVGLIQIRSPRLEAQGLVQNRGNQPRAGVCFYMDADYRGESFCVNAGENQANMGDRYNDKISSIRVFGGVQVVVFENENFSGASRTVTGDMPSLGDWNDRITSFQVSSRQVQTQYGGQYGATGSGNQVPPGACFFMDANYGGESFCVNAGERQANVGDRYNDQISSIRVFGGVQVVVFENENFSGASRTVTGDMRSLGDWNDRITSFQVSGGRQSQPQYGGQYGTLGSGNEPTNGACFYMDADYRGASFCMNAGERMQNVEDRYSDKITSIRVFGRARVIVYENENFSGASRTLTRDMSSLGDFNDRISSIRVR